MEESENNLIDLSNLFKKEYFYRKEKGFPKEPGDYYAVAEGVDTREIPPDIVRVFDLKILNLREAGYYTMTFQRQYKEGDIVRMVSIMSANGVSVGPLLHEDVLVLIEEFAGEIETKSESIKNVMKTVRALQELSYFKIPGFKKLVLQ